VGFPTSEEEELIQLNPETPDLAMTRAEQMARVRDCPVLQEQSA
jgi:hypothetical protein